MKLAIISDLHLDSVNQAVAEERIAVLNRVEADYPTMAGDICEK